MVYDICMNVFYAIFTALTLFFLNAIVTLLLFRAAKNRVKTFLQPPAEGKPSAAGVLLAAVSAQFSHDIVASAKAQLLNAASVTSRQTNALGVQAMKEGGNPIVGMAMDSPAIAKAVKKNPLLGYALEYLAQKITPAGAPNAPISAATPPSDNHHMPELTL